MVQLKMPAYYINEKNALDKAGEIIAPAGEKALIIGGATAWNVSRHRLLTSLEEAGVTYHLEVYAGYCTAEAVKRFSDMAVSEDYEVVVGVGGGRALDTAKAVADGARLPVVCIPTVAGTCAAWSALSILYDEKGRQTDNLELQSSPYAVIVDLDILARAPLRYLAAGIGDTLAKWYEYEPILQIDPQNFALKFRLDSSRYALEILENKSIPVIHELAGGKCSPDFSDVIDSILFLAGLNGSIQDTGYCPATAHAIHNGLTQLKDTHGSLHGEKVVFSLIALFLLENKPESEIRTFICQMNELHLPVTLRQLGVESDVSAKIRFAAGTIDIEKWGFSRLNFTVTASLIAEALLKADELGRESLKTAEAS
ncbi:iron-containing alcohol dehydrogenase family protein [Ethanoligenens harbinense]|uniref:Iron-containing alcohol dehydrogenase n=1 Tax=Ethanoligenens harbinense (strain DSM 18485 / JCM 12961 / CGMCC 1.5033 / YUAN-3) TaxID=663278 RepID=E6U994_ETHHY|nr:iron-containing alcohol dehydrogenase family protein [Ethanoligenens harbinense]ADU27253.1 iron-containing alcohol dehydrogenase [Ethanoligenens harbinense YUAN-3]AVQ96319.1 glycerol dehydrogenase [Ethanoligenens harbinense YUAN-3]AYF38977.1 glycerol dehydrogenase [Ethanoligenens harbinense]AYF41730.1 glycerol dehydrogenase [Ethanoligenens harbinense]QCN92560.1 iron-containing alcohol dehydrogenase [Ethanoligenens harbinense]